MDTKGVQISFLYLIKFCEKFLDTPSADRFKTFVRVHSLEHIFSAGCKDLGQLNILQSLPLYRNFKYYDNCFAIVRPDT
jgi:hypothetical protein